MHLHQKVGHQQPANTIRVKCMCSEFAFAVDGAPKVDDDIQSALSILKGAILTSEGGLGMDMEDITFALLPMLQKLHLRLVGLRTPRKPPNSGTRADCLSCTKSAEAAVRICGLQMKIIEG